MGNREWGIGHGAWGIKNNIKPQRAQRARRKREREKIEIILIKWKRYGI